ncbi:hypothetical protein SUGI_0461460 [Cryptomeria japonica]|nr:hypothetical protein SUGI_0461460 [Cryptomeria japonica]
MELRDALRQLGYAVPLPVLQLLLTKYDRTGQDSRIDYDNFMSVAGLLKSSRRKAKGTLAQPLGFPGFEIACERNSSYDPEIPYLTTLTGEVQVLNISYDHILVDTTASYVLPCKDIYTKAFNLSDEGPFKISGASTLTYAEFMLTVLPFIVA